MAKKLEELTDAELDALMAPTPEERSLDEASDAELDTLMSAHQDLQQLEQSTGASIGQPLSATPDPALLQDEYKINPAVAVLRGFGQGAAQQFIDEASSSLQAAAQEAAERLKLIDDDKLSFNEKRTQALAQNRKLDAQIAKEYRKTKIASEVVGSVATGIATGPSAALTKLGAVKLGAAFGGVEALGRSEENNLVPLALDTSMGAASGALWGKVAKSLTGAGAAPNKGAAIARDQARRIEKQAKEVSKDLGLKWSEIQKDVTQKLNASASSSSSVKNNLSGNFLNDVSRWKLRGVFSGASSADDLVRNMSGAVTEDAAAVTQKLVELGADGVGVAMPDARIVKYISETQDIKPELVWKAFKNKEVIQNALPSRGPNNNISLTNLHEARLKINKFNIDPDADDIGAKVLKGMRSFYRDAFLEKLNSKFPAAGAEITERLQNMNSMLNWLPELAKKQNAAAKGLKSIGERASQVDLTRPGTIGKFFTGGSGNQALPHSAINALTDGDILRVTPVQRNLSSLNYFLKSNLENIPQAFIAPVNSFLSATKLRQEAMVPGVLATLESMGIPVAPAQSGYSSEFNGRLLDPAEQEDYRQELRRSVTDVVERARRERALNKDQSIEPPETQKYERETQDQTSRKNGRKIRQN